MVEKSQVDRKNAIVLGVPIVYFLVMTLLSLYAWVKYGIVKPMDLFVYILFMSVLVERAAGKYAYEVDENCFKLTKASLFFSTQTYQVPFANILGVYRYKAKLIGLMKFRHTFRLHSALDGRTVWTMAYTQTDKNGKLENGRMYIKPSDELLEYLQSKMPGRVKVTEEEIAVRQFVDENK
jgi:hypothetical protein